MKSLCLISDTHRLHRKLVCMQAVARRAEGTHFVNTAAVGGREMQIRHQPGYEAPCPSPLESASSPCR